MDARWCSPQHISSPAQRVHSRFRNCCAEGLSAASRNRMIAIVLRTFQWGTGMMTSAPDWCSSGMVKDRYPRQGTDAIMAGDG